MLLLTFEEAVERLINLTEEELREYVNVRQPLYEQRASFEPVGQCLSWLEGEDDWIDPWALMFVHRKGVLMMVGPPGQDKEVFYKWLHVWLPTVLQHTQRLFERLVVSGMYERDAMCPECTSKLRTTTMVPDSVLFQLCSRTAFAWTVRDNLKFLRELSVGLNRRSLV